MFLFYLTLKTGVYLVQGNAVFIRSSMYKLEVHYALTPSHSWSHQNIASIQHAVFGLGSKCISLPQLFIKYVLYLYLEKVQDQQPHCLTVTN